MNPFVGVDQIAVEPGGDYDGTQLRAVSSMNIGDKSRSINALLY